MSEVQWVTPRKTIEIKDYDFSGYEEGILALHFDFASQKYIMSFDAYELIDILKEEGFI